LHYLQRVIRMIKTRRMGLEGHVAGIWGIKWEKEKMIAHRLLAGMNEKDNWEDIDTDER
jgi:hypothetical protein